MIDSPNDRPVEDDGVQAAKCDQYPWPVRVLMRAILAGHGFSLARVDEVLEEAPRRLPDIELPLILKKLAYGDSRCEFQDPALPGGYASRHRLAFRVQALVKLSL